MKSLIACSILTLATEVKHGHLYLTSYGDPSFNDVWLKGE